MSTGEPAMFPESVVRRLRLLAKKYAGVLRCDPKDAEQEAWLALLKAVQRAGAKQLDEKVMTCICKRALLSVLRTRIRREGFVHVTIEADIHRLDGGGLLPQGVGSAPDVLSLLVLKERAQAEETLGRSVRWYDTPMKRWRYERPDHEMFTAAVEELCTR